METYTAFEAQKRIASGSLEDVVAAVRKKLKTTPSAPVLVFSDTTGKQMDFDLRGSEQAVMARLKAYIPNSSEKPPGTQRPGRPKLGVVAREVSLLPRHWEWLSTQSGGASATIRRLIDEAKKNLSGREQVKEAQERAYKFMTALAGDLPRYEEALRALFAKDKKKFKDQIADWPTDIRNYIVKMSDAAFGGEK